MITKAFISDLQINIFITAINVNHHTMTLISLFRCMMMIRMQSMILSSVNFQQLQPSCCSKNSAASQSEWHEACDLSYSFDIHVLNEACDLSAVRIQLCSLILCVIWYCLHSFILFFLFNLNCTSTSLYILRLEHTLLILYFLSLYSHWEWWHFFKRDICYRYETVMTSS